MTLASDAAGEPGSVSSRLALRVDAAIAQAGGWLAFDRFMALLLYEPGLGYYANEGRKFGWMPSSGSDFVTAPELSPLFGRALAVQVAQALQACGSAQVVEFGAGSGALAEALLDALGEQVRQYDIVELSAVLRERQQARLARFGARVRWLDRLPEAICGVVIGNEVLDAMPVQLLAFDGERWHERGVVRAPAGMAWSDATTTPGDAATATASNWAWADRPTTLRPPVDAAFVPGTVTELHAQGEAFVRTLAGVLTRGLLLFIDYGFPEAEYYHPQRVGGTLMCHRAHLVDADPLRDPGLKDITAHVDFTGLALAAQDAGLDVAGYTSQGRFLINCGLVPMLAQAGVAERVMALKLIEEHEMGELFKVLALTRGIDIEAVGLVGFSEGDRCHRL